MARETVDWDAHAFSGGAEDTVPTKPVVTVGSSDVPAILGLSPHRSPHDAWCTLVGLVPRYDESGDSSAEGWGHIIEPAFLAHWERRHGLSLRRSPAPPAPAPFTRDRWKHARPDGWRDGEIIVEVKTTRAFDAEQCIELLTADGVVVQRFLAWGEDGSSQIPMGYKSQVAWQMHVADIPRAQLIAICPMSYEIRTYVLERDLVAEAIVVERVERWMEAHVWTDVLTPPAPLTYEIVSAMHRTGGTSETYLEPTADDEAVIATILRLRKVQAEAAREENELKARLCARIGPAYGIDGLCTWSPVKGRESIELAALRKKHPDLYQELRKRGAITTGRPSRAFRLKENDK